VFVFGGCNLPLELGSLEKAWGQGVCLEFCSGPGQCVWLSPAVAMN